MFVCTQVPQNDFKFTPTLQALGFKYENGEFVSIAPPHHHFEYFYSDSEQVNDRRKEAMHEAIRITVAQELETFGIEEMFLHGQHGSDVSQTRPEGPHVSLLATKVSELRKKKDVVIVVGAAGSGAQDAGIWAYRIVSRHGGTDEGSAVGLAARVAAYGQAAKGEDSADEVERVVAGTQSLSVAETADKSTDTTPGVVVLNPGQLLYSHMENKPMSQTTWLHRERPSPLTGPYEIDEVHNRVPGHNNKDIHIRTCFEHVLPHILRDDARIYLAVVGDSAKDTIDYLDHLFLNKVETGLAAQLEAVAIVQGNEDPEEIFSAKLKVFLAANGKKWIECPTLPQGRLVQTPGTGKIVDVADYPFVDPRHSIDGLEVEEGLEESSEDAPEAMSRSDDAYADYAKMTVLCPTFSAGNCESIEELVFPRVLGDVLELFWEKKEKAENMERRHQAQQKKRDSLQPEQAPAA